MIPRAALTSFVAVLILASTAAAAYGSLPAVQVDAQPAVLTGEGIGSFVMNTSSLSSTCKTSRFKGTTSATTTATLTLKPEFLECSGFFSNVTWTSNSCGFLLHMVGASSPPTATVDIECSNPEDRMTTDLLSFCTLTFAPQSGIAHVTFNNSGGPATESKDIEVLVALGGLEYTASEFCPGGVGARSNFTISGRATLRAYQDIGKVGSYEHNNVQSGLFIEQ